MPLIGGESNAVIITYNAMNLNNETDMFHEGSYVVVKVSVENVTGDPDPPYFMDVVAQDTLDEIWFAITDNGTEGPWGSENSPNDGVYWGCFQIGLNATYNSTSPSNISYLHLDNGEEANISEIPGMFYNDTHMEFHIIFANYSGSEPPGGNGTGTIRGEVIENETHAGIANATILVNITNGSTIASMKTNQTGAYIFDDNISVGTYDIIVFKEEPEGFPPISSKGKMVYENQTTWVNFTVNFGNPPSGEGNGTIRGWVKNNETEEMLSNITVMINRTDQPQPPVFVKTNETGDYIFNGNVSSGVYEVIVFEPGVFWENVSDVLVNDNETVWVNFSVDFGEGGNGSVYFIRGVVKDPSGVPIANVSLEMFKHGPEDWFENNSFVTNETGEYLFNLSVFNAGPGEYELIAMCEGYVSYGNWSIMILDPGVLWINITLPELYHNYSYIMGRINSSDTGATINETDIIFIDTDLTHMMETEGPMEFTNNVTFNNQSGYYRIPIAYGGTFDVIVFAKGYYAKISDPPIVVSQENTTYWYNFSLDPAEPDIQEIKVRFIDLDDVTVTVNRTIIAESPIIRFAIDFMPGIGNNNRVIEEEEIESFLEMVAKEGPTMNVTLDDEKDEEGPPEFLVIFVNLILDHSNLDEYEPGTYHASLENIANTTADSNATIYYNATFNLTLDGIILNQLLHNFTVSCEYITSTENIISVNFSTFYIINSTTHNANVSLQQINNTIIIHPGNGSSDELAYVWVTLELNTTTAPLPIIDTPTWYVTDQWMFEEIGNYGISNITYSVIGKPFRRWERDRFRIGNENGSYICYEIRVENCSNGWCDDKTEYTTINNLNWIVLTEDYMEIDYIVDDLDFPLYTGKKWSTSSWWGEPVMATVINCSTSKLTGEGLINNTVLINYTNSSDVLLGQEWYSPEIKFFINRTQYDGGTIVHIANLNYHSFAPYIQSIDPPYNNDADADGLIDSIDVNVTINVSGLTTPADFVIEGPFYKENTGWEPPIDITWIWEELRNIDNTNDTITVTISYAGSLIRAKEVNGPFTGSLELRELGEWGPEATIDIVEFETGKYNYTQFEFPAVSVTNITDFGNDTNNNGLYEYLTLNVTLNISEEGNYSINGGLEYVISHPHWDEWWWITGTGTDVLHLTNGTITIPLNFNGREIYDQSRSGKYRFHLEIMNADTWQRIYEKEGRIRHWYNYTDFETPSIYFNKTYLDQTGYHDYINDSTYFTVNVSIIVDAGTFGGGSATYDLHGGLHYYNANNSEDWGEFVTGTGQDITLYEGENIISLNFDLGEIYQKVQEDNYNGSFKIGVGFCEHIGDWWGPDIDNDEYITRNYSLSDFPEPAISMTIFDTNITGGGDFLTVWAYINVSSDEYANNTYDLHGGVHWIDNSTGDENWQFITGMGTMINLSYGSNIVQLNFSGMEIASAGHDGPYAIWMGVDDPDIWEQICEDDYLTPFYSVGEFTAPSVSIFKENITDFINGTDFLTILVPVNVSETGHYQINAAIHWIEHMDNWDNWVFITGTGQDYILSEGMHNISLNFEQGIIKTELNNSGYSGPLMVHIGVENWTTWQPITGAEYETQPYSEDDFSRGSVFVTNHSCEIDEDGNLIVNLTIFSAKNDTYRVNGAIHWIEDMGDWENWVFITGIYEETEPIINGTNYKEYVFNGAEIYNSMHDGPYKIWIGLENTTTYRQIATTEFETDPYSYTAFAAAAPGARLLKENMSEGTVDYMNGSYLTINVSIYKSTNGTEMFWMEGSLEYVDENQGIWEFITGTGSPVTLTKGINVVPLNFNAGDVYVSGWDGPYRAWIGLRNYTTWMDVDNFEYITKSYSADDAPAPPVSFEEMGPEDSYINGSYFTVNVTLNVSSETYAGFYDLHGGVHYRRSGDWWEHITGTGTWVELENGTNTVQLNFNAGEINQSLPDGYYDNLSVFLGINEIDNWEEIAHTDYVTKAYAKNDFPGPSMVMEITGEYVNDSYFTVNATITVSPGNAGEYELHGGVHWVDTSLGWDEWRFITGTGQPLTLSEGVNNVSLNFNGGDIYNTLLEINKSAKLAVWMGISSATEWMEITHDEYESITEYSYLDFNPPELSLTCVSDYNNATKYLTVNVTINATGSSLNQEYDLHAGIHWKQGWEWRFITGTGKRVNLTHNMTIPLNFNGGAIRGSEHNGPYEVWVGISYIDNWEDITHDEYTTGMHNYTDFAAPEVRIIRDNLSDYANGSQYLTVNVTVNASTTGVFFLEGELHWREGFHWQWITWAGKEINISTTGKHTFALNFDGKELRRAAEEGWNGQQLVTWINILNISNWQEIDRVEEYELSDYSPDEFQSTPISFNGTIIDSAINTSGGDKPYDQLQVIVPVNVSADGDYEIIAGLFDPFNDTLFVTASAEINTTLQNVTILFNGTRIYKRGYNGTYEFRAKLINASTKEEYDRMINLTGRYNYTDFVKAVPEAHFDGNITSYIDSNGNLVMNITVNVTHPILRFEVYGELFNLSGVYITYASEIKWLNTTGNHTLQLSFNGSKINTSGLDGPYDLSYLRLSAEIDSLWEEIEVRTNAHTTLPYSHDEFGGA